MSEQELLQPISASAMRDLEEALQQYQFELAMDGEVQAYLAGRGVGSQAVASARLGLVAEPASPEHAGREGFLVIPYLDKDGAPLTMRFRRLRGKGPKYMSLEGDPVRMYNVGAIHRAAVGPGGDYSISITEGEMDCIILGQLGLNAVALPGSDAWKFHHSRMLCGFNEIFIWADPDQAGYKYARTIKKHLPQAEIVKLTVGDVSESYVEFGREAMLELWRECASVAYAVD